MGWLSFLVKPVLDWVYGKVAIFGVWLFKKIGYIISDRKLENTNTNQAAKVENTAEEIKLLLEQGLPVPQELKDKLREESRRLINDTFGPK